MDRQLWLLLWSVVLGVFFLGYTDKATRADTIDFAKFVAGGVLTKTAMDVRSNIDKNKRIVRSEQDDSASDGDSDNVEEKEID